MSGAPVVLVTGSDDALVADAVRKAVDEALGGDDRSLALEELGEEDYRTEGGFDPAPLVDAAQTPPMLTTRRVVLARHVGRFGSASEVAPLVGYLASPLPTTSLVLVWEKGVTPAQQRLSAVPRSLAEAVSAAGGEVRRLSVGRGREADRWLAEQMDAAEVSLEPHARDMVSERLGEDRTRILALLDTLTAVYGPGTSIGPSEVAPYLGAAGGVNPWELTDAIASGDVATAIDRLHRMMGAGERHPLAILAALHGHYGRLLRLDGAGVDADAAAGLLGIKPYPARKALAEARRLGSARIARSLHLLCEADLDLRGRSAWPPGLVVEVLVARLASMARR